MKVIRPICLLMLLAVVASALPRQAFLSQWKVANSGGGSGWTPADITTAAWYDADDASTIQTNTAAGQVSQWSDKSGNGNNATQGTGSLQPATGTRTIGGLNALGFASDRLVSSSTLNLLGGMYFAVIEADSVINVMQIISHTSINVQTRITKNEDALGYAAAAPYWTNDTLGTNTISASTPVIVGFVGGTSIGFSFNGNFNDSGTGNDGSGSAEFNSIGMRGSSSDPFYGLIGEIVFVESSIATADRQKIEGYLAWKWGLEGNLPSDHPYKSAAPTL